MKKILLSLMFVLLVGGMRSFCQGNYCVFPTDTLQSGGVYYYCASIYDGVVIHTCGPGSFFQHYFPGGADPEVYDSVVINESNQGKWFFFCPGVSFFFWVYAAYIPPVEPWESDFVWKCPGKCIELVAQTEHQVDFQYLWSTGETTRSIWVCDYGDYFVRIKGACATIYDTISVIEAPVDEIDLGPDQLLCPGEHVVLYPGSFASYKWDLYDSYYGWFTVSIEPQLEMPYLHNEKLYTRARSTVWNDYDCEAMDEIIVEYYENPGEDIVVLTIDPITGNNKVTWNPQDPALQKVKVYRETGTDIYEEVGETDYQSGNFIDNISSASHAWRYRIAVLDTCGDWSEMTGYHQSIHASVVPLVTGGTGLIWSHYEYQGVVLQYHIYATDGLGEDWDLHWVESLSGNTSSFSLPYFAEQKIVVAAELAGESGRENLMAFSNAVDNPYNAVEEFGEEGITLSPNPTAGRFQITLSGEGTLYVYNSLGQQVVKQDISRRAAVELHEAGVYQVVIQQNQQWSRRKLVVVK